MKDSGKSLIPVDNGQLTRDQVALLKTTVCKGASDDELALFIQVCNRAHLDPFTRQIHAVKRWSSKDNRETMTFQTGIDGYRLQAQRTGEYAGNDDAVFVPADESAPHPVKATVTVYRIVAGHRVPFTATARWSEYAATNHKSGEIMGLWGKMPYGQLAKCAEALALRKGFPAELSDLYTDEEMHQADATGEIIDISPPKQDDPGDAQRFRDEVGAKAETKQADQPKPGGIGEAQIERLKENMKHFGLKREDMIQLCQSLFGDRVKSSADLSLKDYALLTMRFDRVKSGDGMTISEERPFRFIETPKEDISF